RAYPHNGETPSPLPLARRPLRFDLYDSRLTQCIVTKAAPPPVFGMRHQSTLHRIAMKVTQLLDELLLAPHIEIVVTSLPERIRSPQRQSPRDALLQRLHGLSQRALLRLVHQDVNVFGHDDVSVNARLYFSRTRSSADTNMPQ